jgi:hypothetical protein
MQPTHHVLVAVAAVTAYVVLTERRLPTGGVVFPAVFASVLPDVVDKPLAWTFHVIPSGRMLAHSLVVAGVVVACVLVVADRRGFLPHGVAFAWGYLSHLAGDFHPVVQLGTEYYFFPNMFWPLMAANPDRVAGFAAVAPDVDASLLVELGAVVLVFGYVAVDLWRRRGPISA